MVNRGGGGYKKALHGNTQKRYAKHGQYPKGSKTRNKLDYKEEGLNSKRVAKTL